MKKTVLTIGLLTVLLVMGGVAQANLVVNGDMELGGSATTMPDNWTHQALGLFGVSSDTPSGTGQSLYLFDNSGGVYNDIAYQLVWGIETDTEYNFSFKYKGAAGVRAYLAFSGLGTAYANNLDPTDVWTEVNVSFTSPSWLPYTAIELYMYTWNPYADLRIDDVSLTPVPEPMTMGLLGMGGVLCLLKKRFRK